MSRRPDGVGGAHRILARGYHLGVTGDNPLYSPCSLLLILFLASWAFLRMEPWLWRRPKRVIEPGALDGSGWRIADVHITVSQAPLLDDFRAVEEYAPIVSPGATRQAHDAIEVIGDMSGSGDADYIIFAHGLTVVRRLAVDSGFTMLCAQSHRMPRRFRIDPPHTFVRPAREPCEYTYYTRSDLDPAIVELTERVICDSPIETVFVYRHTLIMSYDGDKPTNDARAWMELDAIADGFIASLSAIAARLNG